MNENDKRNVSASVDEAYKEATQSVVDDRMRIDILGPKFCDVMQLHKPATEMLHEIIKKAIHEPEIKAEVKKVIDEYDDSRKARWVERGKGAVGTIILALIIWGIEYAITHSH